MTNKEKLLTASCNPDSKKINVQTKEGLELLKIKAKFYGHYSEQLKVLELIEEIERLTVLLIDGRF